MSQTWRLITFRPFLWIISQFHHGILQPPMKRNLCHCQFVLMFSNIHFFRTITDWNSLSLAVRLSQSTQSFHGALLNSASSNHCWSSWHSGDNGWSAPIAGYRGLWTFRPFTGRFAPKTFRPWTFRHQDVSPPGRFAPWTFRPLTGRFAPDCSRFAPVSGLFSPACKL